MSMMDETPMDLNKLWDGDSVYLSSFDEKTCIDKFLSDIRSVRVDIRQFANYNIVSLKRNYDNIVWPRLRFLYIKNFDVDKPFTIALNENFRKKIKSAMNYYPGDLIKVGTRQEKWRKIESIDPLKNVVTGRGVRIVKNKKITEYVELPMITVNRCDGISDCIASPWAMRINK